MIISTSLRRTIFLGFFFAARSSRTATTLSFAPPKLVRSRVIGNSRRVSVGSSSFRLEASSSSSSVRDAVPEQTTAPATTTKETTTSFVSPAFQVYIEDTDAYGVMYNGNYLRSYERALSHAPSRQQEEEGRDSGSGNSSGNSNSNDVSGSSASSWVLSSVANQKFRSSPLLGQEYLVRGERRLPTTSCNANDNDNIDDDVRLDEMIEGEVEVWHVEMVTKKEEVVEGRDKNNKNGEEEENNNNWVIHNSATVTLKRISSNKTRQLSAASGYSVAANSESNDIINSGKMFEETHIPYHDEFDNNNGGVPHSNIIPIRNALNFFQRSLSNYFGGPEAMRRMQVEDDLLWVVTSVDDGELFLDSIVLEQHHVGLEDIIENGNAERGEFAFENITDYYLHPVPGREVMVQTNFIGKRRGMFIECHHRLYLNVEVVNRNDDGTEVKNHGKHRRLLAQASVTIMALKGSTLRPTSKLPQWLLDLIM